MKYLRVTVEGCHVNCNADLYTALDQLSDEQGGYTEEVLLEIGQEMVNEHMGGWGHEVVDEDQVPVGDRA